MKLRYRTVWISDTHLGSRSAQVKNLAYFLKQVRCKRLYLVGDIVDMHCLRHRWYWPVAHNEVVRRLLKIAKKGAEVIFIPGNHDAAARQYLFLEFGGLQFRHEAVHTTADGRKLLVTHGDQFDFVVQNAPWLAALGTWAYDLLVMANRYYNGLRWCFGLPYSSLSRTIKLKVKSACKVISNFEEMLAKDAHRRGLDGVVCGHIHMAEARLIDGIQYYNCGDWIESCTCVVEHMDGRIEAIDAMETIKGFAALKALAKARLKAQSGTPQTDQQEVNLCPPEIPVP